MAGLSRLTRRIVPPAWRETVEADLSDEAARRHLRGVHADVWMAWHTLRVGVAFRWRGRRLTRHGPGPVTHIVIRDAWRALRSSRAVTTFSVLTLTGAIAAATVTFSVVDAVVLRELPYEDSGRLVVVSSRGGGVASGRQFAEVTSFDHFDAWRRHADLFESLAAVSWGPRARIPADAGERTLSVAQATASLFETLRVDPVLGRLFTVEHESVGRNAVALLRYRAWQDSFGGDRDVIGRSIRLEYRAKDPPAFVTIIGVLPAGFTDPLNERTDVWIPHASGSLYTPHPRDGYLRVIGRLGDGATMEQARAQLEGIKASTAAALGLPLRDGWQPVLASLLDTRVGDRKGSMLLVLWAVGLLMLVACVNVANLLLSRSAERARELALRGSLGAAPRQLGLTLLAESLMLSLTAAGFGILVALWGVDVVKAALPRGLFRADTIALDARVLSVSVSAAIAAGMFFGMVPAWNVARAQPGRLLGNGTWAITPTHRRWRTALVTAEVALVSALLVVSTLFVTSFARIVRADLGFVRSGLIGLSLEGFKGPTMPILDALRRTPGVASVAEWAGPPPLLLRGGATMFRGIKAAHHANEPGEILATQYRVSPGYFETAGIPLLRGRIFTEADAGSSIAIIDELSARLLFFDGRDPIGAGIAFDASSPPLTIVGVVRAVSREGPEFDTGTQLYQPRATGMAGASRFLLRASGPVPQVVAAVRESLHRALPPGTDLPSVQSLEEAFSTMTAGRRANARIMSLFGLVVLVIGAAGVYAVMASIVVQQERELGVRVALGATRVRLIRAVLGRAAVYVTIGLAAGLTGGRALSTLFASMLFDVRPGDASIFVVVGALIMTAGLAAALRPALRAARVDPIRTLRAE